MHDYDAPAVLHKCMYSSRTVLKNVDRNFLLSKSIFKYLTSKYAWNFDEKSFHVWYIRRFLLQETCPSVLWIPPRGRRSWFFKTAWFSKVHPSALKRMSPAKLFSKLAWSDTSSPWLIHPTADSYWCSRTLWSEITEYLHRRKKMPTVFRSFSSRTRFMRPPS